MFKTKYYFLFFSFLLFTKVITSFAAPHDNLKGNLIFLGVNHDSTKSVWLSLTNAAGSFELQGPGRQLIDEWSKDDRGLRLSLSPIVSQGNGGTHHLLNSANNKMLDSQNQKGGIVFPPFPPSQPGEPTHPIVIPPPESPGTPTHPIVIPPIQSPSVNSEISQNNEEQNLDQSVPITMARQFDEGHGWNIWSDNYYFGIRDGQNDINTKGSAVNFTIGADKHITNKSVGGFSLSAIQLTATAFDSGLENVVRGYKIGPYLGYQLSTKWALDGSINYGQLQNHNKILSLNSQYITKLVNATLHAMGLYQFNNFQIRPQPLISYTHFQNPTYDFNGTISDKPVQISRKAEQFSLGYAEFKIEGNYSKEIKNDLIQPFVELGADYSFLRPTNDQVYSGNLALASIPEVSGIVTLGLRAICNKKLLIQASGSYLSVGQPNYNLWDARLLLSYSFF